MKKVAIIIVTYNAIDFLPNLLGSIFNNPPESAEYQVIVVDNNSRDNTVDFIKGKYSQVKLLAQSKNLGFAAGNNLGYAEALKQNFDYLMLLNQDTIITPGYLDELIKALELEADLAAVQPLLLNYPDISTINSLGNVIHYLGFGYTDAYKLKKEKISLIDREINYCSGAACLIKCSVLKQLGFFYEDLFMYHEDLDLGWRFKLQGYKQKLVSSAVVYHQFEFSRSIRKYYYMERNRFIVMFQNYHLLTIILISPALLIMELGLLLFSGLNGWWKEKLKVYAYFLWLKNWQKLLAKRKIIQKNRTIKERRVVWQFSGLIQHQEVNHPLWRIINPFFYLYWQLVKFLIIW